MNGVSLKNIENLVKKKFAYSVLFLLFVYMYLTNGR